MNRLSTMFFFRIIGNCSRKFMHNSIMTSKKLLALFVVLCLISNCNGIGDVIWAVNCGGEAHTDVHGIRYQEDSLSDGTPSDFGKSLMIQRVAPQDQILYQTERYNSDTFGYNIPLSKDGDYVLVLKFSEVWFTSPGQKVFDVMLNGEHTVVQELDIYNKVGRGAAHDEVIPFQIQGGKLKVRGETSSIQDGKIPVQFVKGESDNPKINAMYVMRGTVDDVPKLPPLPASDAIQEEDESDDSEVVNESKQKPSRHISGPKVKDPYANDDINSMLLPVFIAVGACIPILFCLCKL